MRLDDLTVEFQRRFDDKTAAREQALGASRSAIRFSANAIRAIHRGDTSKATELMGEARAAIDRGLFAVEQHPDVHYAGYLQDAQKEYAEARITAAIVEGREVPGPVELDVQLAPYLTGMAESIGELRRHILDCCAHITQEACRQFGRNTCADRCRKARLGPPRLRRLAHDSDSRRHDES